MPDKLKIRKFGSNVYARATLARAILEPKYKSRRTNVYRAGNERLGHGFRIDKCAWTLLIMFAFISWLL